MKLKKDVEEVIHIGEISPDIKSNKNVQDSFKNLKDSEIWGVNSSNFRGNSNVYQVEDAKIFYDPYAKPIFSELVYERILNNINNSFKSTNDKEKVIEKKIIIKKEEKKSERSFIIRKEKSFVNKEKKKTSKEDMSPIWNKYLRIEENKMIISDSFNYSICKFFKYDEIEKSLEELNYLKKIEEKYKNRIAKNYVNFFSSILDCNEKDEFFKNYFDILAQAVFYAFFYGFPKSRLKFNDDLKKKLLYEFSYLFTGVRISNTNYYINEWCLDLGAGNIFKLESCFIILKSKLKD